MKKKVNFPAVIKNIQLALPVVSAGFSVLSAFPFNKKVVRSFTTAAAVTGAPAPSSSVREPLRAALNELAEVTAETPVAKISEITNRALTLARIMVNE